MCIQNITCIFKKYKILTKPKIAFDLRVCQDLDQKLFGQDQGHWQEKCKNHVRSISFFMKKNIESPFSHKDCL